MITYLYLTHTLNRNRYLHSKQSGPGSNGYEEVSTFVKAPEVELHHQMLFSFIHLLAGEALPLCRDIAGVFHSPGYLGWLWVRNGF